jgi:hypothetical protein
MALALTITHATVTKTLVTYYGTMVASGNYVTGGDTANLNSATWPVGSQNAVPALSGIQAGASYVNGSAGYSFCVIAGTNPTNTLVKINSAAATELTGGSAYPTGMLNDTNITFAFSFRKFQ